MPFQLYNTLTKRVEPFRATDPSRITFYTCGPTVYDDAHIGNFRAFLAADLLRRWLESPLCTILDMDGNEHTGPREVRHVMNITDVGHMTEDDRADGGGEDKMQAAAKRLLEQKKSGTAHADIDNPNDPKQIAAFYTERFLEDARKLGLKVAVEQQTDQSVMPHASANIDGMKRMIEDLASKGYAYRPLQDGKPGDAVYFDVQKYNAYGQLSGNTLDKLRGGAGGRVDDAHQAGKKHPADFLLWKSDPSHLMKWPGPVIDGQPMPEGYPGWHIECSVMARDAFRNWPGGLDTIDLHSGGEDNIFPHHECERAQSCCATGHDTFARHWFHTRFLMVEGEKMSKSKGNFFTARDLFARGHDPAAVRLELIKTHYMSQANFTEQGLKDSQRTLMRWYRLMQDVLAFASRRPLPKDDRIARSRKLIRRRSLEFAEAMHSDLNISAATACLETTLRDVVNEEYLYCKNESVATAGYASDSPSLAIKLTAWRSSDPSLTDIVSTLWMMIAVLGILDTRKHSAEASPAQYEIGGTVVLTIEFAPGIAAAEAESITLLLCSRYDARTAKDFATSDRIRDELAAMGYAIKDIAGGKVEVSRL